MSDADNPQTGRPKREFVGVHFNCCNVYSRIYLNPQRPRQYGWCPRCGARVEIVLSPTGSDKKFFSTN
ncbi:MAG TPA: hypothetical protein VLB27_07525 [candidate division Zixibacteria bacterium]|nr:hypothetical protein [candidate division Zixibacteria bacterium]